MKQLKRGHRIAIEALRELAALGNEGANEHLRETGSYSGFDEPGAVEVARRTLRLMGVKT